MLINKQKKETIQSMILPRIPNIVSTVRPIRTNTSHLDSGHENPETIFDRLRRIARRRLSGPVDGTRATEIFIFFLPSAEINLPGGIEPFS